MEFRFNVGSWDFRDVMSSKRLGGECCKENRRMPYSILASTDESEGEEIRGDVGEALHSVQMRRRPRSCG